MQERKSSRWQLLAGSTFLLRLLLVGTVSTLIYVQLSSTCSGATQRSHSADMQETVHLIGNDKVSQICCVTSLSTCSNNEGDCYNSWPYYCLAKLLELYLSQLSFILGLVIHQSYIPLLYMYHQNKNKRCKFYGFYGCLYSWYISPVLYNDK